MPLPGSVFVFLVVLHLPAAAVLESRRAGSGLDLEACSCLLKATLGKHEATIILQ